MKRSIFIFIVVFFTASLLFGQDKVENAKSYGFVSLLPSLIGGFIGGALAVIGTVLSSYYGPKKLETWRMAQKELKQDQPRKKLLLKMLEDTRFKDGRRLSSLSRVTGTSEDECRRLLIEIEARGLTLKDDYGVDIEGWALIKYKPLDEK
jgi:hypothetical protein